MILDFKMFNDFEEIYARCIPKFGNAVKSVAIHTSQRMLDAALLDTSLTFTYVINDWNSLPIFVVNLVLSKKI